MDLPRCLLLRCLLLRCVLVLSCAIPAFSVADTPIAMPEGAERVSLNAGVSWWHPPVAAAVFEDAQGAGFVPAPPGPGYGMPDGPVWFRVDVQNAASQPRDLLLEVAFNKLDLLDVFLVHADGRVERWATGEARPWDTRPVASPGFLFPVSLAGAEQARLLLRVESQTVVNVPLVLHDVRAYIGVAGHTHGWLGVFYGLVLGLLAYNAYLFRATREVAFLSYVAGGVLAMGYFLSIDGYLATWLPTQPAFAQSLLFFCATLSAGFTLFFSRIFLGLQLIAPRLGQVILVSAGTMAVVAFLLPWLPAAPAMLLTIFCSVFMVALMSVAGIIALRAGFRPARWFVLAVAVHLLVLTVVSLAVLALVPLPFAIADALHRVGFVINLLCFTLAIGDRIRMLDDQKRAAEDGLLQAAADARARDEFLSRMSHELRTPMTGILGMTELLEHTDLAPTQRRYIGTLRYSGEMLLTLINDVLDHARLQSGRLQIAREAFDLLRLVDDCRALFEQQPRDNGVILRTDFGAGLTRVAVGDAQRIRQVLVNLLSQAFRQTSRGAVNLRLRSTNDPGWLRCEIEAAAEGRDEARRLLAGPGSGRGGLGLSISRQLVEAMGGRIGVAGDGVTLFWFELPLNAAE